MCIHTCIHTCILDLVKIWLDLTMQCVGSRGEEPRVIFDLLCWIFIHTCIVDLGSFVLDLHTYMHLGYWIFCVGSSYIHASWILGLLCWILFVFFHWIFECSVCPSPFWLFLAILVWIESLSPICCRSSVQVGPLVVDSMFRLEWLDCLEMLECLLGNKILKH